MSRAILERSDGSKVLRYQPLGGALELFRCREPEILIEGPAGTGKSLAALSKINLMALKYPESRHILLRKTRVSLRQSMLVTWNRVVQPQLNGVKFVKDDSEFRYPNGSIVAIGGLDKSSKLMSSEWDSCFVQEATEITLNDVQDITTRCRYGAVPYQQLIMDVNPDRENHFLNLRASEGGPTHRILSRHKDNPALWDEINQVWTEKGSRYMERLDTLTGVRRYRLRDGLWKSAEGTVYDNYDANIHLIDNVSTAKIVATYWSVDFGYTNPFVAQLWGMDAAGVVYLLNEIYMTQTLVEDHAKEMRAMQIASGYREPGALICDHDAEGRATLERYLGIQSTAAFKGIRSGIQAVKSRLRLDPGFDNKPRLLFRRSALYKQDPKLSDPTEGKSSPVSTRDEIEGYVWDTSNSRRSGEEPVDKDNHGMDCMRYFIAYIDNINSTEEAPDLLVLGSARGWGDSNG